MSLKNLFNNTQNVNVLSSVTKEDLSQNIESEDYIDVYLANKDKFVPDIDFSQPSNFAKFGLAEEYYVRAIESIYNTYPYDGSKKEKIEWELSASHLEKSIFDLGYPRTTGYARFGIGSYSGTGSNGYSSGSAEYILTKGGPNLGPDSTRDGANIYDFSNQRECNLKIDGVSGNTLEFWLKKDSFSSSSTATEVIFDNWTTSSVSSSSGYGRMRLEMSASTGSPFYFTYMSGTSGFDKAQISSSLTTSSIADGQWHHYCVRVKNSGANIQTDLFVDGNYESTYLVAGDVQYVSGTFVSTIGALNTAPSGTTIPQRGWGKLSGSIDELRFWKTWRTSKEIERNWFDQVGGGTNTDTANTELGIYYKFNEGITTTSSTDSIVLDYSGRISNGTWIGYDSTSSRSTGSAFNEYTGMTLTEFRDPIIYSEHSEVVDLLETKRNLGREWDVRNAGSLYKSMPSWIVEEHESSATNQDENSLVALTQIMGSYFDTIAAQIDTIPKIKQNGYMSSSAKPYPFYNRLLESEGFKIPELFENASVYEFFNNRTDEKLFEEKLYNVKNLIYQNLYNNLLSIYKSKGTEKSLRNVLRCFGIDNEIYKLNIYSKDHTFELKDNFVSDTIKKKFVNFNTVQNSDAVVYQWQDSTNSESKSFISGSQNFTSGSEGQGLALSFETEIIFPKRYDIGEFNTYLSGASAYSKTYPLMISSSLFGMHTAEDTENDLTWNTNDYANFQVYSVKDDQYSDRGYFLLTSSAGGFVSTITSSYVDDLYDDSRWNFVVSVYPSSNGQASLISGSYNDYTVEFRGFKKTLDNTDDSFVVSSSISNANGQKFLASNKRIYLGAHRTNFTGSTLTHTDVKASTAKVYYSKLESNELENHAQDSRMIGQKNPQQSAFTYQESMTGQFVPKMDSLILHWDFDQVTGSDSSGQFISQDLTSGSSDIRGRYGSWYGNVLGYQYTARGDFFEASSTNAVKDEDVFVAKKQLPEYVYSSEMVNILTEDDINFNLQKRPTSYFMLLEKSMYQNISEEMLKYLNTVIDYNTLIGEPVSRYRESYKGLERLRSHFFERIGNIPDIEKYIEYYKWLDTAVTVAISQTTPASSNLSEEHVRNIVESHIFERNKYRYNFPLFSSKRNENIESTSKGIGELDYNWKYGHYSANSYENALWQRDRKEASNANLQKIKDAITSKNDAVIPVFSGTNGPYSGSVYEFRALNETKKISISSEYIKGINTSFYKPLVMAGSGNYGISLDLSNSGSEITTDYSDLGKKKKIVNVKATILQDTSSVYRSQDVAPFTIMSSSTSGFEVVNQHRDVYSDYQDEPLQSPFTEKHVGGNQARHIYREFNDEYTTRPEAYNITISGTTIVVRSPKSITSTKQQYSYFRDEVAKRPVNIKNIPILTSSLSQGGTTIGNFSKTYELVSVSGRTANNRYLVRNEGLTISSSYSPAISGVIDFSLEDRTLSGNYGNPVIVSRFSPLGSPETDSEGYLDCVAREYSIYSTLNWRNLGIRTYADLWSQQVCGQFGYDSVVVGVELPSTMSGTYENSASYQKVNRNRERRITESGSTYITSSKYDNDFVQHQIPRSDKQYTWINDSITNDIYGFEQPNFSLASRASTDIQHFSQSLYVSAYKFLDLAGMSTFIHETYNPLTMTAQNETGSSPIGDFNSDYNHALITHQNGLNSWPTWKQLRGNAMSRYIASRNILYFVNEKDEKTIVIEPSISTRHKSLDFNINIQLDNKTLRQVLYSISFGSTISKFSDHTYFSANETEVDFSKFFKENWDTKEYKQIKSLIKSDIPKSINPIKSLNYIKYKEQIYPKEQFVTIYRGRDSFTSSFWKSSRTDRIVTSSANYMNNTVSSGSAWIMDARTSFDSGSSFNSALQINLQGEGELQNNFTTFHLGTKNSLKLDILYSRRNEEFIGATSVYAGDTKWEAATQAGVEPAYNSYADYIEDLRRLGKDYNVIPEFRISEHMDYYVNEKYGNFLQDNPDLFTITGSTISSSADSAFYKKYSTTDFLKYFDVVKGDFDDILKTGELSLKCKAIKRFIPYDGFYPAQRTAQLAGLFKDSYSGSLIASGPDSTSSAAYRPVFQPLFAPGILYNTIKSSIAVDYPIYTAPYTVTGSDVSPDGGIPRLASDFDYRVPFEAILEPEVYMKGKRIVDQEPHQSASLNVTSSLVGIGSEAYKLAMNNFMAESINMFLKNGSLTTFASAPDNDSQYFNVTAGKKYMMRVVCSNATLRSLQQISGTMTEIGLPLVLSQSYEYNPSTIKMYENVGSGSGKNNKSSMWGSAFGPPVKFGFGDLVTASCSASYKPFTPPYYGGYSHVELSYNATGSGKVSTSNIMSQLTMSTERLDDLASYISPSTTDTVNRMQLTSSINHKQVAYEKNVKFDSLGNPIEIDGTNQSSRWVIQPKFETPVFDFSAASVTLPTSGSASVNIGMWHQYGQIPDSANKGLFLEIQDLDASEITTADSTGSLADLVGFKKGSQKIGQVKDEQIISEAIIAVPFFINSHGSEERFPIARQVITNAELYLDGQKTQYDLNISGNPENKPSEQIIKMVENMRKFVIPPRMNFLEYKQFTPFAMYIFKFDTKLVQTDLAKIWQNLPPVCADKFEQDEQTISHGLFQYSKELGTELLGNFETKVQWLVFKAKQKASWNYYEKTADSKDDARFKFKFNNGTEDSKLGTVPKYSYNWPYDFCSIVELGKIETEVKLIPKEDK